MTTPTKLTGVVAEHIRAVNDFDTDAIVATFAEDAYVNDARREIRGIDAIRRWVNKEMTGDSVTIEPVEVLDHYGDMIVRGRYDGTYDKTNLPTAHHEQLLLRPRRQDRLTRRHPQPALRIRPGRKVRQPSSDPEVAAALSLVTDGGGRPGQGPCAR